MLMKVFSGIYLESVRGGYAPENPRVLKSELNTPVIEMDEHPQHISLKKILLMKNICFPLVLI